MALRELPAMEREKLLRRCWYSHDACWFAAVTQECGLECANRLNRVALRAQGRREARYILRAFGLQPPRNLEEVVSLVENGCRLLAPPPDMEARFEIVGDRSYEVCLERCFVHENVVRAGLGEGYVCAVFDRFQGWHEGFGAALAEDPIGLPCAKIDGKECRRRLTLREEK